MHSLLGREKKEDEVRFGVDLGLSAGFVARAATMFSCVGCFWVLLSSALVAVCSFSFISPAWIVKDQLKNHHHHPHHYSTKDSVSFGLLWHCSESLDHMYRCYTFGGLGKFAEIPSSSWQTSAVLCSGGCALLAVSSLLAIVTIFLPSGGCERRICTLAGYMQMAAGCSWIQKHLEHPPSQTHLSLEQQSGLVQHSRVPKQMEHWMQTGWA
ncbi:transmembrane protein 211 isoform X2 [Takifugu rubripes]|uniref:transmembrane protein 211 isoform X2 n=1 Tax=Takifugu rubripes TaxID=31033 RepID=UPI0011453E28|nr:transmembrane protein 211-like isoform X2 [Takifugu rubripes]XP_056909826.1 LHFPL tetraspan subfamily member 7 protein isoform X2 [Takifugu flavidus]